MPSPEVRNWFEYWFNSPYYHELYRHRNDEEARAFMFNVLGVLGLKPGEQVLDLACGRGRHTAVLADHGLRVTGIDLSAENISKARSHFPNQTFYQADMRDPIPGSYSAIFNVFTSFGYFDDAEDNARVIQNMYNALRPGGWLVLDYLNPTYVASHLLTSEHIDQPERTFHIHRFIEDDWVIKRIEFRANGMDHCVEEKVRLISKEQFVQLLAPYAMKMVHTFGNYALDPFNDTRSERMIMLIQK